MSNLNRRRISKQILPALSAFFCASCFGCTDTQVNAPEGEDMATGVLLDTGEDTTTEVLLDTGENATTEVLLGRTDPISFGQFAALNVNKTVKAEMRRLNHWKDK